MILSLPLRRNISRICQAFAELEAVSNLHCPLRSCRFIRCCREDDINSSQGCCRAADGQGLGQDHVSVDSSSWRCCAQPWLELRRAPARSSQSPPAPLASAELDALHQWSVAEGGAGGEGTGCHLLLFLLGGGSQGLSWDDGKHLSADSPRQRRDCGCVLGCP